MNISRDQDYIICQLYYLETQGIDSPLGDEEDKEGNKKQSWFQEIFSTHPPIEERIRILREMK